jgi:hypothetical protein
MSAPDSLFEALLDGWGDEALSPDVKVPECRCGRMLKISEYKHGECETCQSRLRLPCVESVSPRVMRRYRRPT